MLSPTPPSCLPDPPVPPLTVRYYLPGPARRPTRHNNHARLLLLFTSACNRRVQTPETGGETGRALKRGAVRARDVVLHTKGHEKWVAGYSNRNRGCSRSRLQTFKGFVLHRRGAFSEREMETMRMSGGATIGRLSLTPQPPTPPAQPSSPRSEAQHRSPRDARLPTRSCPSPRPSPIPARRPPTAASCVSP